MTFPLLSALAHSPLGQTQGGGGKGAVGYQSAPRTTSIFLPLLAFLPATLFLEKGRPLFFPSANINGAFRAWCSSRWAFHSQPPIHRAGRGNGNGKYRALWDKCSRKEPRANVQGIPGTRRLVMGMQRQELVCCRELLGCSFH